MNDKRSDAAADKTITRLNTVFFFRKCKSYRADTRRSLLLFKKDSVRVPHSHWVLCICGWARMFVSPSCFFLCAVSFISFLWVFLWGFATRISVQNPIDWQWFKAEYFEAQTLIEHHWIGDCMLRVRYRVTPNRTDDGRMRFSSFFFRRHRQANGFLFASKC